jgi:transposase
MLHLCALMAMKYFAELKDYYLRKKAGEKHGLLIMNVIKNKLVLRRYVVVKNQQPYIDNYQKAV